MSGSLKIWSLPYVIISISAVFIFYMLRWVSDVLTSCSWLELFKLIRDLLHQVTFHLGKVSLGNLLARVKLHLVTELVDLTRKLFLEVM